MKRVVTAGVGVVAALLISATPSYAADGAALVPVAPMMMSSAASETPGSVVLPERPPLGTSITLSEKKTKAIVAAFFTGGTGAAVAICQTLVPVEFKDACSVIVGSIGTYLSSVRAPQPGMCLKINVKLGKPPFSVAYVRCPAPPSPSPRPPNEDTNVQKAPGSRSGGRVVPGPGGTGVLVP
jgi:hypothetical protein